MTRYFFCFLLFCSVVLSISTASGKAWGVQGVNAESFLDYLEPEPSSADIYDFLSAYKSDFVQCKNMQPCLRALEYLVNFGDTRVVSAYLDEIKHCVAMPDFTGSDIVRLNMLKLKMTSFAAAVQPEKQLMATNTAAAQPEKQLMATNTAAAQPEKQLMATNTAAAQPEKQLMDANTAAAQPEKQLMDANTAAAQPEKQLMATNTAAQQTAKKLAAVKENHNKQSRQIKYHPPIHGRSTLAKEKLAYVPPATEASQKVASTDAEVSMKNLVNRRSGDSATSRLWRFENGLSYTKGDWSFSATSIHLNSGSDKGNSTTGSNYLEGALFSLTTRATVFTPQISFKGNNISLDLKTTPLNGEIQALPAGRLTWSDKKAYLSVFQESVTDSLLSYIGFKDIYSGQPMGRVLKTGLTVGWNDDTVNSWFYGGSLTGSYLFGKNVKNNQALKTDLYLGKSFGVLSAGLYSSLEHFTRDLNHFTFGHGGYYSPQAYASSAAFVSYSHKSDSVAVKLTGSAGYLYEKIDDVSMYFNTPGQTERAYSGSESHKLTLSTDLESSFKLSSNFQLNCNAKILNSRNFTENTLGFNLNYQF